MVINETINNGKKIFDIIEENGNNYLIEADTEELAIAKYNEIKYREANPLPPSYKELRAKEYPPIQDQLDMMYWDKRNGTNNWEKTITAVKEKYPKT